MEKQKGGFFSRFRRGAEHTTVKPKSHLRGDARDYVTGDADTYKPQSMIVASIIDYIANDIATQTFTHERLDTETMIRINRLDSPIYEVLNLSLKDGKTNAEFWTDAMKTMLNSGWVYITPVYYGGTYSPDGLLDLVASDQRPDSLENTITIKSPYSRGHQAKTLMDKMYEILWRDMSSDDAKAFLKINGQIDQKNGNFSEQVSKTLDMFFKFVEEYGIGILDNKTDYSELKRDYRKVKPSDVELIEKQVYSIFGVTEEVILGNATQVQMKLYKETVVSPINQQLITELNRVLLSKYLRVITSSKKSVERIGVYENRYQYASLAEISEAIKALTNAGVASRNEIRGLMGLQPIEGGADIVTNLNNVSIKTKETNNE